MKLCVLQGTFNPIHNAHISAANFVSDKFDKIIFIPAANPPHKNCDPNLSQHRFNMVKLAVQGQFDVSDIEYKRGGKSYTYLTICELYKKYDVEEKICFIIGTDAFKKIETWYKTDELKKLVKFLVFVREDKFDISEYDILKSKGYDFEFQNMPYEDISSTELRKEIKQGADISRYVPPQVEDYIRKNELYKD
ncbi:nicotinate-nucleotide adenylyltransferase [bacterium]|nr:nicotinate-nucleotide adenylyltransferase [bacterium]